MVFLRSWDDMKELQIRNSIIKTLCYADVFEFPMNKSEIFKYYIGTEKVSAISLSSVLNAMVKERIIDRLKGYYLLIGRKRLVGLRYKRRIVSHRKLAIAKRVSAFLARIPTVRFVGISGSLSMNNCRAEDDIDLFIISSKNTLWITRLFVNLTLLAFGNKRSRNDIFGADLICPNMFLAEDNLEIPDEKKKLFSAHEVAQLKPVINKVNTYEGFLLQNAWINNFIPNFKIISKPPAIRKNTIYDHLTKTLNFVFYILQRLYMLKKITKEEVGLNVARFHPKDKGKFAFELFNIKYKYYLESLSRPAKNKAPIARDLYN